MQENTGLFDRADSLTAKIVPDKKKKGGVGVLALSILKVILPCSVAFIPLAKQLAVMELSMLDVAL